MYNFTESFILSSLGNETNTGVKEEVVCMNEAKKDQDTLKHSYYNIQMLNERLCKAHHSGLKVLTFSSGGLSFLPSPS